jgi:hypothetical protein
VHRHLRPRREELGLPLLGSRFDKLGKPFNGAANRPLEPVDGG